MTTHDETLCGIYVSVNWKITSPPSPTETLNCEMSGIHPGGGWWLLMFLFYVVHLNTWKSLKIFVGSHSSFAFIFLLRIKIKQNIPLSINLVSIQTQIPFLYWQGCAVESTCKLLEKSWRISWLGTFGLLLLRPKPKFAINDTLRYLLSVLL